MRLRTDQLRMMDLGELGQDKQSRLGQFMTSAPVATWMASLFPPSSLRRCRLLDAGAGAGALSRAFLERWASGGFGFREVQVDAYEIDDGLREELESMLGWYAARVAVQPRIVSGDFIQLATNPSFPMLGQFTHAILNPPYKKINSNSSHRLQLRRAGVETVNLYSAFVSLGLRAMAAGGIMVAIIPRSFCNGPYYRPFREFLLDHAAIRHIHLFGSRTEAFKRDKVLQENVIIMLERGAKQGDVTVSTSTDDTFLDLATHVHAADKIIVPGDLERFIHVPSSTRQNFAEQFGSVCYSLDEIGISVSTGPVVDFRLKEHLRSMPGPGTAPLLYPAHFSGQSTVWPKAGLRKPNAIQLNNATKKWLYPTGFYCLVRRFSSKEEHRRVVATVVQPDTFGKASLIGFENHLNVFHAGRSGLTEELARGLSLFLNTSAVDEEFRRFNGHTQVNVTDLKNMKYPSRDALITLGQWAMAGGELSQANIDRELQKLGS